MGQPNGVHTPLSNTESIGIGREPPELKHLSRASERGRGQTERRNPFGVRTAFRTERVNRMAWEGQPKSVRVT